jgi:hypothetical protein
MADETTNDGGASAQLNELTSQMHQALQSGDQATARRLSTERSRVAEAMTAREQAADEARAAQIEAGDGQTPTEAEPGEPDPDATVNEAALTTWQQDYPEESGPLIEEWGGAGSPEFADHLRYARYGALRAKEVAPDIFDLLSSDIEMPSGKVVHLGDHPSFVRLASLLGRQLANRDGDDITPAQRHQQRTTAMPQQQNKAAAEEEIEQLTEQIHAAYGQGLYGKANKLMKKRAALSERMHGTKPYQGPLTE